MAQCFFDGDIRSPFDMIGWNAGKLERAADGLGLTRSAFMQRAVARAKDARTRLSRPEAPEKSSGLETLIQALKKPDDKVHVDLYRLHSQYDSSGAERTVYAQRRAC